MENLNTDIKARILDYLRNKPFGASSSDIAKGTGHNRITVTKYLEIMKAHKILACEDVAQAKLWRISEKRTKPTVLIVDDEPHVVDLVALSLISSQYNISKAYSGLDALEKIYTETPDLIILDLMMPGINGYEICRRVKENAITQHIPIIILSAKGQIADKLEGISIGADDYVTKPFDPMELEARVGGLLRRVKRDIDTHPLTLMPGIETLKSEVLKRLKSGQKFIITSYTIGNFEEYKKEYGYKKGESLIVLVSRMLSDMIKERKNTFIAHSLKDDYIIVSEGADIEKDIRAAFKKLLPYVYCEKKPKKGVELITRKIQSSEVKEEAMSFNTISEALRINMR